MTSGDILIDGQRVNDLPPQKRDVAMVFQSYALYPHMTVYENIAFPLEMAKLPTAEIKPAVHEAARKVAIEHLLERKPGQLSGGQQQRCALARAIVRQPRLFLLDEPLSNLDAKLRLETRAELRKLQRSLGVTAVYVTHDQEEAMTVADRMAVFMEGRIVQVGTPHEIFRRPATVAVAEFIGTPPMNLLPGVLSDGVVQLAGARLPLPGATGASREVMLGVRPGDLTLGASGIPARVEFIEDFGDSSIVNLDVDGRRVKMRSGELPGVQEGQQVLLAFAPSAAHLFDRASGERI
jgi:ABC-type sugar transport system ATPase subunit